MGKLEISWVSGNQHLDTLAAFFTENIALAYISHSELMSGRAIDPDTWNPDIGAVFRAEMAEALDPASGSTVRIAVGYRAGVLASLAYVNFIKDVPRPYIVLEDIVVSKAIRGGGIGQAMVDWIFAAARSEGVTRAFLESGQQNCVAHRFFERNGFHQTSIVMMAELGKN